jgi:hypothetical protein
MVRQQRMADLLGSDFGLAEAHKLYACHNLLLAHKDVLFSHLTQRWRDLFNADFDTLPYDLTSTYFEVNAADLPEGTKRRHGYSHDKRPDCPQLVIALVVTPEACRWPTRCCRATPPTARRCVAARAGRGALCIRAERRPRRQEARDAAVFRRFSRPFGVPTRYCTGGSQARISASAASVGTPRSITRTRLALPYCVSILPRLRVAELTCSKVDTIQLTTA